MNIDEYLRQNYNCNNVDPVTNSSGQVVGYYAQDRRSKNEIYIPVNAINNPSLGMVSYIPGSGGSSNDARVLREQIQNNPPDYIISISSGCGDDNNCIQTGLNLAQGLGSTVDRNVTVCFSASGFIGLKRNEELLQSNPNIKTAVVSCEPYGQGNFRDGSNLANSQTPIIFAAPDAGFHINMLDLLKDYKNSGLNAYLLETDYSSDAHIATNRDILSSGILDYILGNTDNFDTTKGGGNGWEFLKYDPTTGQIVNANFDEIQGNMTAIPDITNVLAYDAHTITQEASQVNDKYKGLKDIQSIGNSYLTEFSSSYKDVYTNVNDIRSKINVSSFVGNLSTQVFRSGEGIPGCIGGNLENFFDAVGSLLNTLSLETDSMMSYADAIYNIDNELSKKVNEGKEGKLIVKDNSDKVIPIGLEKKEKEEENKDNNSNKNNSSNKNSNNNHRSSSSGNYSSSGGYHSSPRGEDYTEEKSTEPLREGPCYDENRKPDYVYSFGDYEGYIYTDPEDPNKVIGIKYRYTCKDSKECITKMAELKEEYKDKEYINDILINKNYVDLVFSEESFKDKTLDEITELYFADATKLDQYEEVTNNGENLL